MSVVRFHCNSCASEFPPSLESCPRCGKTERSHEIQTKARPDKGGRGWRLGAAWMSVVAAAFGLFVAVMCVLARDAFFGVVTGAVTAVLYANIAVGAFRNRRGAFLTGVVVSFFPASLLLVRALEFATCLYTGEFSEHRRHMWTEVSIFSALFLVFAAHLVVSFIAWVKYRPREEARA